MIILPAIDIKDGTCVRLYKGDFATAEKVADNYMQTAKGFASDGAKWIHMVDLDGAKNGTPVNSDIFIDVAKNTCLKVELGGGIRNIDAVEYYISNGISRVILGSIALKNSQIVMEAVKEYGDRIAVGIDSKNGMVAAEGWLEASEVDYIQLALQMIAAGVKNIIFTDISKDGTLSGVNLEQLSALKTATYGKCNIIASGGVHTIADITACKKLDLYGVICGKSIYSGTLDLKEAIKVGEGD
ncbi:MAG: 1-(5-phosphoribosyl)-5-[(5-phosphoribosylamino)methylideneamino]imidazole-4-carboxamide isomerase [Oscillospiraceae bacterium]|nr:1-(5-phosphoribosyl)-5-[(5-phosphoribosylamino)methylideneamino]imidazole-4-carboxamide isomerase [Oscillospiraceae bacterium]